MRAYGTLQLIMGIVLTIVIQGFLYLLWYYADSEFAAKFVDRGVIPHVCVFLTSWGGVILLLRGLVVRRQRGLLDIDYASLPESGMSFRAALEHIREAGKRNNDSVVAPRLVEALQQFRATREIEAAKSSLRSSSDADFYAVQSNYTLVRVFLWTIPILGFIGTVIGVGGAVGGFAEFLSVQNIEAVEEIKGALMLVTGDLGIAFDTTFVGLLLSVVLMFWYSLTEKRERDQLQRFELQCDRAVLQLLSGRQGSDRTQELAGALKLALRELVPGLELWSSKAEDLSRALTDQLLAAWTEASRKWFSGISNLSAVLEERTADLTNNAVALRADVQTVQQAFMDSLSAIEQSWKTHSEEMANVIQVEQAALSERVSSQNQAAGELFERQQKLLDTCAGSLTYTADRVESLIELQNQLEQDLLKVAGSDGLVTTLREVQSLIATLSPVLQRLTEKPLDVEVKFLAVPGGATGA